MNSKLTSVETQIRSVLNDLDAIKDNFKEVIKDKSYPLDTRWNLFLSTPDLLKKNDGWIVHFKSIDDDDVMYEGAVMHVERHETVHTKYIADSLLENEDVRYDAFREEVLEMCLGSYEYDW